MKIMPILLAITIIAGLAVGLVCGLKIGFVNGKQVADAALAESHERVRELETLISNNHYADFLKLPAATNEQIKELNDHLQSGEVLRDGKWVKP